MAKQNRSTNDHPVRLLLEEKREGGYYHVNATIVEVRPDDDLGIRSWGKLRNIDTAGPFYVKDLEVTSQGSDDDATRCRHLYSWTLAYAPYRVELEDAARMVQTLTILAKRRRKLDEAHGRPITFGQYLGRVAVALGIEGFVMRVGPSKGWGYDDNTYRFYSIKDGIAHTDWLVGQWADEPKTAAMGGA